VKKISEEEFSHFCILGDGLLGWEPNVLAKQLVIAFVGRRRAVAGCADAGRPDWHVRGAHGAGIATYAQGSAVAPLDASGSKNLLEDFLIGKPNFPGRHI
jgi:hypothetical protein